MRSPGLKTWPTTPPHVGTSDWAHILLEHRLLKLAGPLSVFTTFRGLSATMDVIAVGHLSSHDLSSVVLGTSICSVFGMSIMVGLSSAMETLCGQVSGQRASGVQGSVYALKLKSTGSRLLQL